MPPDGNDIGADIDAADARTSLEASPSSTQLHFDGSGGVEGAAWDAGADVVGWAAGIA